MTDVPTETESAGSAAPHAGFTRASALSFGRAPRGRPRRPDCCGPGAPGGDGVRGAGRSFTGRRSLRAPPADGCLHAPRIVATADRGTRGIGLGPRCDGSPPARRSWRGPAAVCVARGPVGAPGRGRIPRRACRPARLDRRLLLEGRTDRIHPWGRRRSDRRTAGEAVRTHDRREGADPTVRGIPPRSAVDERSYPRRQRCVPRGVARARSRRDFQASRSLRSVSKTSSSCCRLP